MQLVFAKHYIGKSFCQTQIKLFYVPKSVATHFLIFSQILSQVDKQLNVANCKQTENCLLEESPGRPLMKLSRPTSASTVK